MPWVTPTVAALAPGRAVAAGTPANPWLGDARARDRRQFDPDAFVRCYAATMTRTWRGPARRRCTSPRCQTSSRNCSCRSTGAASARTPRCGAQWWRDAEAIVRLEALWRSREHLKLDPRPGCRVWLRDHLDHHMAVVLSADGPV
jgi:hypothetical protein